MTTFPTSIKFDGFKLTPNFLTYETRSLSGYRQVQKQSGQYWEIEASTPPLTEREARRLLGFFMSQEGRYGVFTLVLPRFKTPQGAVGASVPLAATTAGAGNSSLATDGWAPSATVLFAGDVLKFANHNKVYCVTEDIISDSGGNAVVSFKPSLFANVADNEALTVTDVPWRVSFMEDSLDFNANLEIYTKFTVRLRENWNT